MVRNLEQTRKAVFAETMNMRWGEMDALGHMNNVSYFRYFEESRISWFNSLPINYKPNDQGPILANINCHFVKPAIYPIKFKVTTAIGKLGNTSFIMWTDILGKKKEECFASAEAVMVWIDMSTGKPCPVPRWFRDLF